MSFVTGTFQAFLQDNMPPDRHAMGHYGADGFGIIYTLGVSRPHARALEVRHAMPRSKSGWVP